MNQTGHDLRTKLALLDRYRSPAHEIRPKILGSQLPERSTCLFRLHLDEKEPCLVKVLSSTIDVGSCAADTLPVFDSKRFDIPAPYNRDSNHDRSSVTKVSPSQWEPNGAMHRCPSPTIR